MASHTCSGGRLFRKNIFSCFAVRKILLFSQKILQNAHDNVEVLILSHAHLQPPACPRRLRFSSFPLHRSPRIDRKTHELPLFVDRFNYGKLYYWDVSRNDESVREMNCRCDVCVRCKHELNFNEFDQMIKLNFLSRSNGHGRHDIFSPGDLLAVGNNSGFPLRCFWYIIQMENIYSSSLWWWWSVGNLIRFSMELSLAGSYNSTFLHLQFCQFLSKSWCKIKICFVNSITCRQPCYPGFSTQTTGCAAQT